MKMMLNLPRTPNSLADMKYWQNFLSESATIFSLSSTPKENFRYTRYLYLKVAQCKICTYCRALCRSNWALVHSTPQIISFKILKRYFSPGIDSDSLCSLAGRYDNPIITRFLAPMDCSKIPAHVFISYPHFTWISQTELAVVRAGSS